MFAAGKTKGVVNAEANYIESCFSTYLYTGNSSSQTITNGIDLSGKGGMVWMKNRSSASTNNLLMDSARGVTNALFSNLADAQNSYWGSNFAFNSSGFNFTASGTATNASGETYASWTFRKQAKFFDVVTYTGNGVSGRQISHSLGSVPGCIIVKQTSGADPWFVYHQSRGNGEAGQLNSTAAFGADSVWNYTDPTATGFTVNSSTNTSGATFVAYLFAHNAGGFGLTGTDNVISCGSYVGNGSANGPVINLGYEPQWVLAKGATDVSSWRIGDNMRGLVVGGDDSILIPNSSAAETLSTWMTPTATGFQIDGTSSAVNTSGSTYIYIAIRRGPMKVPTDATKVFAPALGQSPNPNYVSGFPVDLGISEYRVNGSNSTGSRLQGSNIMDMASTSAESSDGSTVWDFMNGYYTGGRTSSFVSWMFRRAPSFFDEVCYTGNSTSGRSINHNLTVVPQLVIVKNRTNTADWAVFSYFNDQYLLLNLTNSASGLGLTANSTTFNVGSGTTNNASGDNYAAYLFATCPGVSKVGSYTGNGTTQTINCGFTGGARFVLIKRTDASGGWYVYDTARGMTVLTDPYLFLNSTAAESATLGSVITVSTGFAVNASILAAINTNGASYIFLAIA